MTHRDTVRLIYRTVAWLALAPACFAQSNDEPALTGSVSLGARAVTVDGTKAKYLQDVNLDDGVRVAGLHLSYVPDAESDARIDRLDLDAEGLGGDPYETIHFGVRKYGAYRLALDHRRSEYFYDDTILPAALASVAGSTGGDYHTFDFERIRDTASLDIDLSPAMRLSLGLERQTRSGDSATTLSAERDEFELDRPLDETLNGLTIGLRQSWQRVTLIATEEWRDFDNTSELVLPGASAGSNLADTAALSFFMRDQSYDYRSRSHRIQVLANPTARLDLTAGWQREALDLDALANEHAVGTTFTGAPFDTTAAGAGNTKRDVEIGELHGGFRIGERVRLIGGARHSTLDQNGALTFGADVGAGAWDLTTDGIEVGVELALSSALTLAVGWSHEDRSADYDWLSNTVTATRDADTKREGSFARLAWATDKGWQLTASAEDNAIDSPYTLASATDSRRYKLGARRTWESGLSLAANYRKTDVENDNSRWIADTEQADLRIGYRRERMQVSYGHTRIDLTRSVDQAVTAGTRALLVAIDYDTAAMLRDLSGRWQVNRRFAFGGEARDYDTHGSVTVARNDVRAYLDVAVGSDYTLQVSYRDLDYAEDAFDAYDARILEVGLRLAW